MVRQLTVFSIEDFRDLMEEEGYDLTSMLVDTVLENLNEEGDSFFVGEILIEGVNTVIELMVERSEFKEILERSLVVFADKEEYERCSQIKKVLAQHFE